MVSILDCHNKVKSTRIKGINFCFDLNFLLLSTKISIEERNLSIYLTLLLAISYR